MYFASKLASEEYPDLDVTTRGAMSLGRRLQDPLAELVKIPPQAIGVGQYQHDLNQAALERALTGVVENVVNRVGVDPQHRPSRACWATCRVISGRSGQEKSSPTARNTARSPTGVS